MESFATYPIISIQSYKKNIKYHNYYISVQRKSCLIDFCDRASELCDKLTQWTIFFAPIIIIHYYNNTLPHYSKHIFLVHSWPLVLSRPHCLDIYVTNPDNQDNWMEFDLSPEIIHYTKYQVPFLHHWQMKILACHDWQLLVHFQCLLTWCLLTIPSYWHSCLNAPYQECLMKKSSNKLSKPHTGSGTHEHNGRLRRPLHHLDKYDNTSSNGQLTLENFFKIIWHFQDLTCSLAFWPTTKAEPRAYMHCKVCQEASKVDQSVLVKNVFVEYCTSRQSRSIKSPQFLWRQVQFSRPSLNPNCSWITSHMSNSLLTLKDIQAFLVEPVETQCVTASAMLYFGKKA